MKINLKLILKRIMITTVSITIIIVLVGVTFVNVSPEFGGKPSKESLRKIKNSSNFLNGSFQNLQKTVQSADFKWSTIPNFFKDGNNKTPKNELPSEKKTKAFFINKSKQPRITWFGHSAVFIEMENQNIFIDPMLGNIPSPHPWLGSERFNKELPISIDSLPNIDVVLISHDHYDHLDYGSIKKLKDKVKQFYVSLGIKAHLVSWGIDPKKVKEFDWWESMTLNGIEYVATPARHFSGRGITDRNSTLWCSWVIKSDSSNIFFSGDSGYGEHFKEIGQKYGPFDFSMMECGQYNEQWSQIHMMPEETIQAAIDVKSKLTMPIHWGAFKLALHSWDDPIIRATKAAKDLKVNMATPILGESIVVYNENYPSEEWWAN